MNASKIISIILVVLFVLLSAQVVVAGNEGNQSQTGSGPGNEEAPQAQNQEQNKNGTNNETQAQNQEQNQNGTCNGTQAQNQEQNQNGTCNGTQAQNQEQNQNGTCNGTQAQNQEQNQNGTCNGTQAQNQQQNQNGTCNGTQEQNREQERTQEQQQNSSGNQTSTMNQYRNQEKNQDGSGNNGAGNGNGDQDRNRWRYQYRNQIQQGIDNGTIVKECNISKKNGNMYINSYEYQKGMDVEVEKQNRNKLQIRVSAEFREGKVLVLNIEKNAFQVKNSEQLRVRFDGQEIAVSDIEDIVDGEGTEAQYTFALGEDGGQYIIYIPHFSEHIITLEILDSIDDEEARIPILALSAAILTIVLLILIVVRIGKFRE
jgi:hypothetical protein